MSNTFSVAFSWCLKQALKKSNLVLSFAKNCWRRQYSNAHYVRKDFEDAHRNVKDEKRNLERTLKEIKTVIVYTRLSRFKDSVLGFFFWRVYI